MKSDYGKSPKGTGVDICKNCGSLEHIECIDISDEEFKDIMGSVDNPMLTTDFDAAWKEIFKDD